MERVNASVPCVEDVLERILAGARGVSSHRGDARAEDVPASETLANGSDGASDDSNALVRSLEALTRDVRALSTAEVREIARTEALGRVGGACAAAATRGRAADAEARALAVGVVCAYAEGIRMTVERGEVWRPSEASHACAALASCACAGRTVGEAESRESSYRPPHARDYADGVASRVVLLTDDGEMGRVAALGAIAALARSDGKALRGALTTMLPTSEHQLAGKSAATSVVKAAVGDQSSKVRAAAASATAALFDGPASKQYLAMAECAEPVATDGSSLSARVRSFSALSTTLGSMVVTTQRSLLRALCMEKDPQCVRELCKAISSLCDAAPFDRLPRALLLETMLALHGRIKKSATDAPNERAVAQGALFGAFTAAISARGSDSVLKNMATNELESIVSTMISHARGDAAGARCESFGVLRALVVHHVSVMASMGDRLRELFPKTVCASEVDDRVCQASARLLADYLGAVSGSGTVREDVDEDDVGVVPDPASLSSEDLRAVWLDAIEVQLPTCASHKSALTRVAGLTAISRVNSNVVECFGSDASSLNTLISSPHIVLTSGSERVPAVRAAACRALGFIINLPDVDLETAASSLLTALLEESKSVKIPASWALANLCSANASRQDHLSHSTVASLAKALIANAEQQGDKVRANATRGLGYLITASTCESCHDWLHEAAQSLASCLTTGNSKTQWNACLSVASLLANESAVKAGSQWIDFVVRMLLLLIRDARNFKIRMCAAAALSVGAQNGCLGSTFSDLVNVLTSSLEALTLQNTALHSQSAMDFKYKPALVFQLSMTLVCVMAVPNHKASMIREALKKTSVLLAAYRNFRLFLTDEIRTKSDPRITASLNSTPAVSEDTFSVSLQNIVSHLSSIQSTASETIEEFRALVL